MTSLPQRSPRNRLLAPAGSWWNQRRRGVRVRRSSGNGKPPRMISALAGVDLYTIQRAGGWKTQVMVQRYAHLSPDHIRAAVERLVHPAPASATVTNTGTAGTGGNESDAETPEKIGAPGGNRTPDPRLRSTCAALRPYVNAA